VEGGSAVAKEMIGFGMEGWEWDVSADAGGEAAWTGGVCITGDSLPLESIAREKVAML
jgi:hypothetical protein